MDGIVRTGEKIHFIVSCMGRLDYIKQTIEAAVSQPNSTYTFVDYSCPQNSGEWVREHYPQANVVFVKNKQGWNPSEARNAGARVVAGGWLCFLDGDVVLHPEFSRAALSLVKPGAYLRAPLDQPPLYGLLVCSKEDFAQSGGYDEIMRPYGWEDVDIRMSLERTGTMPAELPGRLVKHIDHDDGLRTNQCDIKEKYFSTAINQMYSMLKDHLLKSGEHCDRATLQSVYLYSRERFLAGYPWLSWLESEYTPLGFASAFQTLASIGRDYESVAAESWGSVRTFRIERSRDVPMLELLTTYQRQTITVQALSQSHIDAMRLTGEIYPIPVANGRASIVLTGESIFLLGEAEIVRDIEIAISPAEGPSLSIDLRPYDNFTSLVEMELIIGGQPRIYRGIRLDGTAVHLQIPVTLESPAKPEDITISISGAGVNQEIRRRTTFLTAAKVTEGEATSLTPPRSAFEFRVGGRDNSVDAGNGKDIEDYHADVAWGWTDTALVCWIARYGARVSDGASNGDGVQIAIQPENLKAQFASSYQFKLCWKDGRNWVGLTRSTLDPVMTLNDIFTMEAAGDCRRMAVRLPFEILGIAPAAGHVIGLSLIFPYNDGDGVEGGLEWGGGMAGTKNPREYNEITLAG